MFDSSNSFCHIYRDHPISHGYHVFNSSQALIQKITSVGCFLVINVFHRGPYVPHPEAIGRLWSWSSICCITFNLLPDCTHYIEAQSSYRFSRGSIPVFLRKPIATCNFPGKVRTMDLCMVQIVLTTFLLMVSQGTFLSGLIKIYKVV